MLHPSQTRWLSLFPVIDMIIKQWDALRLFFDAKWVGERLESAERIHVLLNDAITKAFYLFMQWILPKVTNMKKYFQSEKSVTAFVHERMTTVYKEILSSFMKRDYVCSTPVNNICPSDESKWLPLEQTYLGVGVMNQLSLPNLRNKNDIILDFKRKCRLFLSTLNNQFRKRYDFEDPVLKRLYLLSPETAISHRERETTVSSYPCFFVAKDR